MTAVDLNRVDGALARGDVVAPEVWNGLDSVIAGMPFFAPKRAVPAIIVETHVNQAQPRLHQQSDMETIGDRAGISGDGNGVDAANDRGLVTITGNDGNGNVEIAANDTVIALPEAGGRADGNDVFPRPKSRKGFSKELRRVWDWLDAHANEITHDLPVQRDVAEATDVSHPTAGKALKRWRDHNGVTKPVYYHDQAS